MGSKVKTCTCTNEYQDKKYGDKQRVHSKTAKTKGSSDYYYRCTVCGSEK